MDLTLVLTAEKRKFWSVHIFAFLPLPPVFKSVHNWIYEFGFFGKQVLKFFLRRTLKIFWTLGRPLKGRNILGRSGAISLHLHSTFWYKPVSDKWNRFSNWFSKQNTQKIQNLLAKTGFRFLKTGSETGLYRKVFGNVASAKWRWNIPGMFWPLRGRPLVEWNSWSIKWGVVSHAAFWDLAGIKAWFHIGKSRVGHFVEIRREVYIRVDHFFRSFLFPGAPDFSM